MMRRFILVRDEDVTGVSGTGKVAEGVLWSDQTVTIKWLGRRTSEVSWPGGVDDVNAVHGHNGATRVVWVDEDYLAAGGLHTVAYPDGSQVHCYCDLGTDHQAIPDHAVGTTQADWVHSGGLTLRTPEEWAQIRGVRILDPDSWRAPGAPAWTQPISEAEFERRLARCTVNHRPASTCRCEGGVHVCE